MHTGQLIDSDLTDVALPAWVGRFEARFRDMEIVIGDRDWRWALNGNESFCDIIAWRPVVS